MCVILNMNVTNQSTVTTKSILTTEIHQNEV